MQLGEPCLESQLGEVRVLAGLLQAYSPWLTSWGSGSLLDCTARM